MIIVMNCGLSRNNLVKLVYILVLLCYHFLVNNDAYNIDVQRPFLHLVEGVMFLFISGSH